MALLAFVASIFKVGFTGYVGVLIAIYLSTRNYAYSLLAAYTGIHVPELFKEPIALYLLIAGAWFSLGLENYKFDKLEYNKNRGEFLDKMKRSAAAAGRKGDKPEG